MVQPITLCVSSPHEPPHINAARAARVWEEFLRSGTTHSCRATFLPYIVRRCEAQGIPYLIKARPGQGYYIRRLKGDE